MSDALKEFSERHEEGREPFATWRSRKLDELRTESVWIVEETRATFNGRWIQAENIFYFSEVSAREKAKWLEQHSAACWEYRVRRYDSAGGTHE